MRRLLSFGLFLSVSAFGTLAFAQPASPARDPGYTEHKVEGATVVSFQDEVLTAPLTGAMGDTIRRPPGAVRVGLIRPRYNFLVELTKSVENL